MKGIEFQEKKKKVTFNSLNEKNLNNIISYLDVRDFLNLNLTCKKMDNSCKKFNLSWKNECDKYFSNFDGVMR
jgi:hypothetical protein